MEHMHTQDIERAAARMYRALTAAWRKWEADRRHTPISGGIPYVYQTKADES